MYLPRHTSEAKLNLRVPIRIFQQTRCPTGFFYCFDEPEFHIDLYSAFRRFCGPAAFLQSCVSTVNCSRYLGRLVVNSQRFANTGFA